METLKKIAKYTTNALGIIAMLITGIDAVDGITIPYAIQIVQIIAVIQGVIGTYLLSNKAIYKANLQTTVNEDGVEELIEEGSIENED